MKKSAPLLVYLRKDPKRAAVVASFSESIVDALRNAENTTDSENEILVTCKITAESLILAGASANSHDKAPLRRPPFCPIKSLMHATPPEKLPEDVKNKGVLVGVVVLLESADNKVLLTRRARSMRTFPSVWVPPGGHVEKGESLIECGMRELEEETGIKIDEKNSASILGLWESSFPVMKHLGMPRRHHIVAYLHHKHSKTASTLSEIMKIDENEVDACTWICSCVTSQIVSTDSQFIVAKPACQQSSPGYCHSFSGICIKDQDFIDGIIFNDDKEQIIGKVISTAPLFAEVGKIKDNERVSTGTKYALKLWLDKLQTGP